MLRLGAVYVKEPVDALRLLTAPSPDGTTGFEKVYEAVVVTSWIRSFRLGTVVEGIVDVVLDRVPQATESAAIGPMAICTDELLVLVPSVTW